MVDNIGMGKELYLVKSCSILSSFLFSLIFIILSQISESTVVTHIIVVLN